MALLEMLTERIFNPTLAKLETANDCIESLVESINELKEEYSKLQKYCMQLENDLVFQNEKYDNLERMYRTSEQERSRLTMQNKILKNQIRKES